MTLGGFGQFITETDLTPAECRGYALSQPITTLSCGATSMDELDQDIGIALNFQPLSESDQAALRDRVRDVAVDGRHEWFKTNNFFDNGYHRDQHGFPEQADIRARRGFYGGPLRTGPPLHHSSSQRGRQKLRPLSPVGPAVKPVNL